MESFKDLSHLRLENMFHPVSSNFYFRVPSCLVFNCGARKIVQRGGAKVERHEFEAKGTQYSLERPESRGSLQFSWEDGTVQKVDSIQRTLFM